MDHISIKHFLNWNGRIAQIAISLCFLLFIYDGHALPAQSDRDISLEILNKWTSIRWGEENLAWVVYYSESLIDPWVKAEVSRRKMRPDQAVSYRNAFVDELRIDSTTPILFSIQIFGNDRPAITPLSEHIALIDSTGRRIKPMVIEKNLETPMQGLTQGLVFFPKQSIEDFSIVVSGLVPDRETIFAFDGAEKGSSSILTSPSEMSTSKITELPSEEVIIKIPTKQSVSHKIENNDNDSNDLEVGETSETYAPTRALEETQTIGSDIQVQVTKELEKNDEPETTSPRDRPSITRGMMPRQALDLYLRSWIAGDTDTMYAILSEESQNKISRELFERETNGSSFKNLLKSGYKVSWKGETSAKVTVARRLLLMRSLESRTINFVIEDGTARVTY